MYDSNGYRLQVKSNENHDALGRFAGASSGKSGNITVHSEHSSKADAHSAGSAARRAGNQVFVMRGSDLSKHLGVTGVKPDKHYVYSGKA